MRRLATSVAIVIGVLQLLAHTDPLAAQTNVETNAPGIQLNFSTPGARSLALGGTFLGRADDATAAYANPAGLANLPEREASVELRGWGFTHLFTEQVDAGVPIDGESTDGVTAASFASFVYPGRRWAVALYLHTLANFEANFETRGGRLADSPRAPTLFPMTSKTRLEIISQSVSTSYRLSSNVSIGLGLSRYEFEIDSTLARFDFAGVPQNTQTQNGKDSDLGVTAGLLWRLSPRWQVGGIYRQGPSFRFVAQTRRERPSADDLPVPAVFTVPDQVGVGVMFRATERVILGFDYYRIKYSAFVDRFAVLLDADETSPDDFFAEDGNEYHFGLEYGFGHGVRPWFVRSGLWYDPSHGIRYLGGSEQQKVLFRDRDGVLHWAAGGGVTGGRYQVDLGMDYSERTLTFSLSTVMRF